MAESHGTCIYRFALDIYNDYTCQDSLQARLIVGTGNNVNFITFFLQTYWKKLSTVNTVSQVVNALQKQIFADLTLKLMKFEPSPAIKSYRLMNLQELPCEDPRE